MGRVNKFVKVLELFTILKAYKWIKLELKYIYIFLRVAIIQNNRPTYHYPHNPKVNQSSKIININNDLVITHYQDIKFLCRKSFNEKEKSRDLIKLTDHYPRNLKVNQSSTIININHNLVTTHYQNIKFFMQKTLQ